MAENLRDNYKASEAIEFSELSERLQVLPCPAVPSQAREWGHRASPLKRATPYLFAASTPSHAASTSTATTSP